MKSRTPVYQISENLLLRPLAAGDAEDLTLLADDRSVWENLRDSMPTPYTYEDALGYIDAHLEDQPPLSFGIFFHGKLAGMVGLNPGRDVNRITGEVGYWVGVPFRRQGIATEALCEIMRYAFAEFGFFKLTACVFEGNDASVGVLKKCGFEQEATLQKNALKNGVVKDEWRFFYFNPNFNPDRFQVHVR